MDERQYNDRLSQITTLWSLLRQAHGEAIATKMEARQALIDRYYGAAYRYLLGATRDEEAALELFQEFAVRFLRGDFRRADAARGRFRDYLKTSLIHLVSDHRKSRRLRPQALPAGGPEVVDLTTLDDGQFERGWRDELIDRAWQVLKQANPIYHAALRLHVENPELTSVDLAARLAEQFGKPLSAGNLRVMLHRGREKYAEVLVEEVAQSLNTPSAQELRAELNELHLLALCQTALEHRPE